MPLDEFVGSFTPPGVTFRYTCGLAAVAFAMVLLPIVYLLMIAVLAYALWWYATVVLSQSLDLGITLVLYASPLIAGSLLILFMLKPLFAARPKPQASLSLDPARERLLVEFVDRVCELLRAPRPSRIDVNVWPNASASLQGGVRSLVQRKVVLTIGLPLVAGLNARELAGVLAHELRHFSQGTGMRFSYAIRSINLWLARVAFERDEWDKWLAKPTNLDPRLSLGVGLGRVSVRVTRSILTRLFLIGHAISCFLLWQMEYDADRCGALLSGSDAFASGLRRVDALAAASQLAGRDVQHGWSCRELPDDLPHLVALRVRDAGPLIEHLANQAAARATRGMFDANVSVATRQFDTHPAMEDRMQAVRNLRAPGVFRSERPASDLFSNLTELSRTATREFYEKQNNLSLDGVRIVPSEAVLAQSDAALAQWEAGRQAGRTILDFCGGTPFRISPLPAANPHNTGSSEDLLRQLGEARQRMRRERARATDVMRRYHGSGMQLMNLKLARHLTALGVALSQLPHINVRLEDVDNLGPVEATARAWTRVAAERDALCLELAPVERAAIDRIGAALALLPLTPGPLLGVDPAVLLEQALMCGALNNALDAPPHAMRELQAGAVALSVLENPSSQFDSAAVKEQISQLHEELMPILLSVVASAGDLPYPIAEGDPGTVAAHLRGTGELTLTVALPRLMALGDQSFARVIEIVRAVEDAWQTHLTPIEATSIN